MRIIEIENELANIYSKVSGIDKKSLVEDLDNLLKRPQSQKNVADELNNLQFKTTVLDTLPELADEYIRHKNFELSERVNDIRKRYEVEKMLLETGGIFLPIEEFDHTISHGGYLNRLSNYEIISSIKYLPTPITYDTFGNVSSIKEPSESLVIFGRTINDFKIMIDIDLKSNSESLFIDIAGADVKLIGKGQTIELDDGWKTVNISSGKYTIEIDPYLNNGSFNIIFRQLIFSKEIEEPEVHTYTKMINHFGTGIGFKVVGSINSLIYNDITTTDDHLYIGDLHAKNIDFNYQIPNAEDDHFIDCSTADESTNKIGTVEGLKNGRGIIVSDNIHEYSGGVSIMASLSRVVMSCMFYISKSKLIHAAPFESVELYKIDYDYKKLVDIDTRVQNIITDPGLYLITSSPSLIGAEDPVALLNMQKNYIWQYSQTKVLLPVYVIDNDVYLDMSPAVYYQLMGYMTSNVYLQTRNLTKYASQLTITSEKPIYGVILLKS